MWKSTDKKIKYGLHVSSDRMRCLAVWRIVLGRSRGGRGWGWGSVGWVCLACTHSWFLSWAATSRADAHLWSWPLGGWGGRFRTSGSSSYVERSRPAWNTRNPVPRTSYWGPKMQGDLHLPLTLRFRSGDIFLKTQPCAVAQCSSSQHLGSSCRVVV